WGSTTIFIRKPCTAKSIQRCPRRFTSAATRDVPAAVQTLPGHYPPSAVGLAMRIRKGKQCHRRGQRDIEPDPGGDRCQSLTERLRAGLERVNSFDTLQPK